MSHGTGYGAALLESCWLVATLLVALAGAVEEMCQSTTTATPMCTCQVSGHLFDFSPLTKPGAGSFYEATLSNKETTTVNTFYYNPCRFANIKDDSAVSNDCVSTLTPALCQQDGQNKKYYSLGSSQTAQGFYDRAAQIVKLKFLIGSDVRMSEVSFMCDKSATDISAIKLEYVKEEPAKDYQLRIRTALACLGGPAPTGAPYVLHVTGTLSVGSQMTIIFFCVVVVYLLGGVAYNRFAKDRRGADLIPNLVFWTELPSLVKDGCLVLTGRKGTSGTYEDL